MYLFDPDLPPKLKTFEQASASQIKTFRECERKWALGKLAGLRAPETESQLRGTRIHRILELYLKGEAPIPNTQEGTLAAACLSNLPDPSADHAPWLERYFKNKEAYVVPVIGYVDFWWLERRLVVDHKTTSSPRYMKTPEELRYDVQAIMYGKEAIDLLGWDEVNFGHNYIRTDRVGTDFREVTLSKQEIEDGVGAINVTLSRMKEVGQVELPHEAPPTGFPDACSAYGGCPFQSICAVAGLDTRGPIVSALLRQQYGTAPVEQGESSMSKPSIADLLANANKTPAPVAQTEPAMTEEPAKKRGRPKKDLGINPPPVSMQVQGAAEALQEYVKPVDEAVAPIAKAMTEAEERVRKQAQAVVAATVGVEVDPTDIQIGPPSAELSFEDMKRIMRTGTNITTIYVDCTPAWDHARLEDLLAPAAREYEKASGNPHYLVVKFDDGVKAVAALAQGLSLPPDVHVDSRTKLGQFSLEILRSRQDVRFVAGRA